MTMPRSRLVDLGVTRYYHCISRCVRRAFLCGEGFEHRKAWIEQRLELLSQQFAIAVCGYAVMDNHLHVLLRLDPHRAESWTDEEVVRRWLAVYPPPRLKLDDPAIVQAWVDRQLAEPKKVQTWRKRLTELGWLMKALKEPLARMANKEDDCKGTFWEGRFKSIAVVDEEALLATCAYIDLNPVAAGAAKTPETSRHTSLRARLEHARKRGRLKQLAAAKKGSVAGSRAAGNLEQRHWLCPLEDRRRIDSDREGMFESCTLGSYLLLVDYSSRIWREGKARVSPEVAGIFERLQTSAEFWDARLKQMLKRDRLYGHYAASKRAFLQQIAQQTGAHHLDNAMRWQVSV